MRWVSAICAISRGGALRLLRMHQRCLACAQVTLFKRNYHHVVSDAYFKAYHTVARGNPNYFITYGNGKSAARVQSGLRPNGAHRWYSYVKAPKCAPCVIDRPACLLLRSERETL